ncbi:MAG TPA: heavy metal translocating P-type ATPase [Caldilineae bacterium]|nr:heavy metal translocating P-type ATPase [Caldilineae bacterium]
MIQKLKLEIPLLLPENSDCEGCIQRLQEALCRHKGIDEAHVDQNNGLSLLCLHYDPNLISLAEVERHAREMGIAIQQRYRHREWRIVGMDCADCAAKLEKGVGRLKGVLYCAVNFAAAKLTVEYDVEELDQGIIIERIRQLGYDVAEEEATRMAPQEAGPGDLRGLLAFMWGKRRDTLTLISGLLIVLAFILETIGVPAPGTHVLYALAIITGGYYVARKGLTGVWINRELDINFLMTIAALGAAAIGAWEEGALVVFLFSLGETLESYTMDRARNAIRSLMDLAPAEATVLRPCVDCEEHLGQPLSDGTPYESGPCPWCDVHEQRVPVAELIVGDIILIRPGERIPMDGRIIRGTSAVNQAPITGESIPVEKGPGDEVFAGTINGEGALEVEVTRLAADNTLSRIIHMVEEAQAQKAPTQRWVDVFARYYTPAVVGLAVLIAAVPPLLFGQPFLEPATGGHGWLYRALALLIIACPCALVISTPVSIVSAISNAARNGVLIKGGAYLEAAGGLRVMAFDKTGTLTEGKPSVTDVIPVEGWAEGEILRLAAAVESRSEHLLAQAIVRAAEERGLVPAPAQDFQALTGRGAQGWVGDRPVYIGNRTLLLELGVSLSDSLREQTRRLEEAGKTVMVVITELGERLEAIGLIAVADTVRPDAREAIAALKRSGIRWMVMLTGDNERTARAIAAQVGIDEVRANLLPDQKVGAVEEMLVKHGQVAMVGDGVNDAPALARATVGIAMGGAGTDQALETADIVLMADDLSKLPFAIHLSRSTLRIIRQNIAFSLLVKAAFMGLAIPGVATLWMAVFADMGASLIVIFNGMRLLKSRIT